MRVAIDPDQVSDQFSRYSLTTHYFWMKKMPNMPVLPADLLNKHDTQAPSYTTYPTAPQFHANFNGRHFARHSMRANASLLPKDLSIYVYLPFCLSLDDLSGSVTAMTRADTLAQTKKVNSYLQRLQGEITLRGKLFSDDRLLTHIHFGGATANLLSTEQLANILDQIALEFHLDLPSSLEISIDLDPRHTSPLEVEGLAECGINHFSIVVQSFSKNIQIANHREPDEERTLAVIEAAMRLAKSVNLDLITGLPMQDISGFEETLSRVIDIGVTRIAAYDAAYTPKRIRTRQMVGTATPSNAEARLALSSLVRSQLLQANYRYIGMDYYVLPSDSLLKAQNCGSLLRNFQGYTTHRDTDLIGVGTGAISKLDTAFSQNESTLAYYSELIDDHRLPIARGIELSNDDRIRADVIQQIMCRGAVDMSRKLGQFTESNNATPLFEYLKRELLGLKHFEQDGLVLLNEQGFEITETGRYFMRPIAAVFDRYLTPSLDKDILPFSKKL